MTTIMKNNSGDQAMLRASVLRIGLFFSGLAAVFLSIALQSGYARDPLPVLPGPETTAIIAMAGAAAIGIALYRGRKK